MIAKLFHKHETAMCILLIVIYVAINSFCLQNFGTTGAVSALVNVLFAGALLALMANLKRTAYYGLVKVHHPEKYLFFTPLMLIASVNLWGGIQINNSLTEIIFHVLMMMNVGFIEEIIFRGFLYRMMEKDNPGLAMAVSAVTFGMGHIVNLLNGEAVVPTLLQLCYAMAIGWLFVVIFRKSGSLLPCILTHGVLNSLSVFARESELLNYVASALLVVISLGYAEYIRRKIKTA